jgi:hypothetical protein
MNFEDANQILDEERAHPTVGYAPNKSLDVAALLGLLNQVGAQPKVTQENPRAFEFKCINYELLSSLASHFDADGRTALQSHLLARIGNVRAIKKTSRTAYPTWNSYASELPLIGEFLVRSGGSSMPSAKLRRCRE